MSRRKEILHILKGELKIYDSPGDKITLNACFVSEIVELLNDPHKYSQLQEAWLEGFKHSITQKK